MSSSFRKKTDRHIVSVLTVRFSLDRQTKRYKSLEILFHFFLVVSISTLTLKHCACVICQVWHTVKQCDMHFALKTLVRKQKCFNVNSQPRKLSVLAMVFTNQIGFKATRAKKEKKNRQKVLWKKLTDWFLVEPTHSYI